MTAPIDPASDRPVFRQIADALRGQILTGRYGEGAQLPSERDLTEQYAVARGTARQALAVLKAEGLVETGHGRGAFVRRRPPLRRLAHDRFARRHRADGKAAFLAEAETSGVVAGVEVIKVGRERAPAGIAERLGVPPAQRVLVRRRRYLADGLPVELATSYLPWDLVAGTPITKDNPGPGGIYARLEEAGHRLARFTEDVRARMPTPEEAQMLRMAVGVPVFDLLRLAYDTEERVVEACDTVMAADRFILSYELPAG